MISIAILDDHLPIIAGLRALLEGQPDLSIVFDATRGKEFLDKLEHQHVDVALLDIKVPDISGIEVLKQISTSFPRTRALMLTMEDTYQTVNEAMHAGAAGYVLKNTTTNELVSAIHKIARGEKYVSPMANHTLIDGMGKQPSTISKKEFSLTKTEKRIMELIAEGLNNEDIGKTMSTKLVTVQTHRKNTLRKSKRYLGISTMPALVAYLIRNELMK